MLLCSAGERCRRAPSCVAAADEAACLSNPSPLQRFPPAVQLILGTPTPLPVVATLIPIMLGVAAASAAELSFNWMGFFTAMMSNLTFGFRAVWSKK
mgnify:CR=1 FL=1